MGIYIPEPVNLDSAHETDIKTAIVVEIKLVCHVIYGVCANDSAEHLARCRKSSYTSGFYGQGYLVQNTVLSGILGYSLRNSNTYVDYIVRFQFQSGPSSNDLCACIDDILCLGTTGKHLSPVLPL